MKEQPTLLTERLILRPFDCTDADRVQILASDERIADVTANIPHPYPDGLASQWIATHKTCWLQRELAAFAIVSIATEEVIGCISLMDITDDDAEIGYWIGVPYWNTGFCSEACNTVIEFAFSDLGLKKVYAHHLTRNPASGKVLLNTGFSHTGSGVSVCGYRTQEESVERYEILRA